jgi:hypothetical protein
MTYQQQVIKGPFKGIWDATPKPNTPPESFDDAVNFFFRKGRIQSRPKLVAFTAPPDGKVIREAFTFADASAEYHTLILTDRSAYYVEAGGTYTRLTLPLAGLKIRGAHSGGSSATVLTDASASYTTNDLIGYIVYNITDGSHGTITGNTATTITVTSLTGGTENDWDAADTYAIDILDGTNLPYAIAPMNGRLYFSNGSNVLMYCDGNDTILVAGDCPFACRFLTANAFHLIAGYITNPVPGKVGSTNYPIRIQYSKSGDPNDWTSLTSGLNDLVEVPDQITGLTTLGRNTFIARTNGFTMMAPTGVSTSPFTFEQYNYAPKGIGNRFPYSLATYGNTAIFVSADDIYRMDGASLSPIGGNCKKKIFEHLAQASGDQVRGFIIPRMGIAYDFLSYWLSLPGVNYSWVYNLEENTWTKFYSTAGRLTCLANIALE